MKYQIEDLKELTDAKSFMNGYLASCSYISLRYIVYIIAGILISIITWSLFAEKEVALTTFGEINLTQNQNVCTIYIENTQIGSIKENDDVQIEIISLSKSEYGVINSTIDKLSQDVIVDQNNGRKYYTANCILDKNTLIDKKGNKVELKNGMEAKVRIISYKTTYFNYIAQKL